MSCAHCCFACTGKGSFMSQAVFDKCLELAASREEYVTIGGGEPTLHPKCVEWVMQAALALVETSLSLDGPAVLVITNGKKTETAIKLAKLCKLGVIQAELSQDEYHDEIEYSTVEAFKRYASIRDVTNGGRNAVIDVGRASKSHEAGLLHVRDGCACSTLFIDPQGDVWGCGCKTHKFGNILQMDSVPQEWYEHSEECWRELHEDEAAEIKKFRCEPIPA